MAKFDIYGAAYLNGIPGGYYNIDQEIKKDDIVLPLDLKTRNNYVNDNQILRVLFKNKVIWVNWVGYNDILWKPIK